MTLERIQKTVSNREFFAVKGPDGGVHFHYTPNADAERRFGAFDCGIEMHKKKPLYEGQAGRPCCWLIGCECFHDGSTLWAQEEFLPVYFNCKQRGSFRELWELIEGVYHSHVSDKSEVL